MSLLSTSRFGPAFRILSQALAALAVSAVVLAIALASTARANSLSTTLGNPTAGQQTGVAFSLNVDEYPGSLESANVQLPYGLLPNWSALTTLCSASTADGPDPVNECPTNSQFGTGSLSNQLAGMFTANQIMVDSGGPLPTLMLVAQDPENSIDLRVKFDMQSINTTTGSSAIQFTDAPYNSLANNVPGPTTIDVNLTANALGHALKVATAGSCNTSSAGDAVVTLSSGAKIFEVSDLVAFSGCATSTQINSGPSEGGSADGSTASFSYSDSGSGSFTTFKCGLVRLNDNSTWSQPPVTCGSTRSGSSKTYTGLEPGIYQFRVQSTSQPTKFAIRRFVVATGSAAASANNPVSNQQTELEVTADLGAGSGALANVTVNLPARVTLGNAWGGMCQTSDFYGESPLDDCPAISRIGTATIRSPLFESPIPAEILAGDSGSSLPELSIIAQDPELGVDVRVIMQPLLTANHVAFRDVSTMLYSEFRYSPTPVSGFDLHFTGNIYGEPFKMLAVCTAASSVDVVMTAIGGGRYDAISQPISNGAGCDTATTSITSGPAEASTNNGSSVTFDYGDTGTWSPFNGFTCKLIDMSNLSTVDSTACGTTRSGSSQTYTNLAPGVYAFVVSANGSQLDIRRFRVGY